MNSFVDVKPTTKIGTLAKSLNIPLIGQQVIKRVKDINTIFENTKKKLKSKTCICKKRSIFFDFLYWSNLDVRHCIDVMHVEKKCV